MAFKPESDPYIQQAAEHFTTWLRNEKRIPLDELRVNMEGSGYSHTTMEFALIVAAKTVLKPELEELMAHDVMGTSIILLHPNTHERVKIREYAARYGISEELVHDLAEAIKAEHKENYRSEHPHWHTRPEHSSPLPFAIDITTAGRRGHRRKPQE